MTSSQPADTTSSNQRNERRILFVVNEAGEFVELQRIAEAASRDGWSVAFLFAQHHYINLAKDTSICSVKGYDVYSPRIALRPVRETASETSIEATLDDGYLPHSLVQGRSSPRTPPSKWQLAISTAVLVTLVVARRLRILPHPNRPHAAKPPRSLYLGTLRFARLTYRAVKPSLVVYGQDFPGSPNAVITRCCNQDGVPTVIVPFALGTTKEMVESLHDKPAHQADSGITNQLAAQFFPHWVNYYKGKKLLRLPGDEVIVQEGLGLAPPHPWLPNSSHVTKIAVENEQMRKYYRRMDFPEHQLALTGSAYDDILAQRGQEHDEQRSAILRRLQIDPRKKLLVCAWPTNQFGSRFEALEFSDYEQLCHAWAAALERVQRTTEFQVIICPHPVTPRGALREILKSYDLSRSIANIGTLQLVPCCDLFVACVSSTIRWAIALGIPALNYDCYRYGYTDFDAAAGVKTVFTHDAFETQLLDWTSNAERYAEARRAQQMSAPEWGMHDGKSTQRILELFNELTTVEGNKGLS